MALYLLPNTFDDQQSPSLLLPEGLSSLLCELDGLIAESERTGRRYLIKLMQDREHARRMPIYLYHKGSSQKELTLFVEKIVGGEKLGLISDAGMPVLADPGNRLVRMLRKKGYEDIHAIPGPSSIFLALILSGFPAQSFHFHGYLPKEKKARRSVLQAIEKEAQNGSTQLWMETPYRNAVLFEECIRTFHPTTYLALASDLTLENHSVKVFSIAQWRTKTIVLPKHPTIFLLWRARAV